MNPPSGALAASSDQPLPLAAGKFDLVDPRAPGPISYGQGPASELNLASLWRVMWEWRWMILSVFAVGIAGAVIITLLTPRVYQSVAVIELNPPRVEVINNEKEADASPSDINFIGTQLALLQSRALAERVVQDLNLGSNPAFAPPGLDRTTAQQVATTAVRSSLTAEVVPNSSVVRLSMNARNPALAATIVNAAADGYINSSLERRYQASSYARDFLQRQIAAVRQELENSEREVVAYAQQQHLVNVGSGSGGTDGKSGGSGDDTSLAGETLATLNGALATAQTKLVDAEQRYRESLTADQTSDVAQATASLRAQAATLNADYQQKLKTFRPDYPDMVRLKAQIDSIDKAIQDEANTIRQSRTGTLKEEYLAARSEEENLQARVNQLSAQVLDLRGRNIRYNILQRDVDTNRMLYDALLQRYKEIGVAGGIGSANASVVDRGHIPSAPFKPNLYLNLLFGSAAGLAFGVAAALMLEFVNDTVKSPNDVRDKLRLAFIGGVPTSRKPNPIDELAEQQSGMSEGYFSIATALQYATETGIPSSLLVTSTRAAEGKSTSAWALAQSFSKLGRSVLLIDADLRRPAFLVRGEGDEVGLSLLLTNTAPLVSSVLRTEVPGLWMVPSGPIPPNPPELLASSRFAALLEEARQAFDVVVIDGPPVLGIADAPLLSAKTAATLLVIEAGRTRTRAAVESINRLRAANAHLVGAIFTRYRAEAAYGYGYGYGYGQNYRREAYSYKISDKRRRRIQLTTLNNSHDGGDERTDGPQV